MINTDTLSDMARYLGKFIHVLDTKYEHKNLYIPLKLFIFHAHVNLYFSESTLQFREVF